MIRVHPRKFQNGNICWGLFYQGRPFLAVSIYHQLTKRPLRKSVIQQRTIWPGADSMAAGHLHHSRHQMILMRILHCLLFCPFRKASTFGFPSRPFSPNSQAMEPPSSKLLLLKGRGHLVNQLVNLHYQVHLTVLWMVCEYTNTNAIHIVHQTF